MIINKDISLKVLQAALSTGGDFAEIYAEDGTRCVMNMIDNHMENAVSGRTHGAGIRVLNNVNSVYVYTNDTTLDGLLDAANQAAAAIVSTKASNIDIVIECKNIITKHPVILAPSSVSIKKKAGIIKSAYASASDYDELIQQVSVSYADSTRDFQIINSEGLCIEDTKTYTRLMVNAVASNGSENQTGVSGPGRRMGFEVFDNIIDPKSHGIDAARCAVTMLKADPCPAGKMMVAIDNGFGGVIFHEACGHSLEATSVAKGQSVFCDMMGEKIASDIVTAIDDATIVNGWGSNNIDDEGTPCQKTTLIENGILKSYLVDKLNGRRMGAKSTGSSRRASYSYAPTSRMSNTYIANGKSTKQEILSSMTDGLYCAKMGGGSVNPVTGEFNFSVVEGYLMKNGVIDKPVRGATLIGKGSQVLLDIDMVGNNLAFGQGMCGSKSGSLAADVGQPIVRVKEITVGGGA